MSMKRLLLAIALALACEALIYAQRRDLTIAEARELVMAALQPEARELPKLSINTLDRKERRTGFDEFAVTWDNPNGSAVFGFFAVNQATGDVWKLALCRRADTPDLRKLQDTLRDRVGLDRRTFTRLRRRAPCEP
jgi:hypothetical protein